jgi:glycosyltransferase involved in cell wall biosynthesis
MKICMVAQNASLKFGGEASLPWLFFKYLRQRGIDIHLVIHARTRSEVLAAFPNDQDRIHFSPETKIDRLLWKIGSQFPDKIDVQTFGVVRHLFNQKFQKKIVRQLIAEHKIDLVHEMTPVSPKQVSLMYNLGVPVVIGPLAGGMTYPPAFKHLETRGSTAVEFFGRALSAPLNALMPGKKKAAALIVANDRAKNALPHGVTGKIYEIPDAGVDLAIWDKAPDLPPRTDDKIHFVYLGRLADVKGIQFLIPAFKKVADQDPNAILDLLGDGERRPMLEQMTQDLGLTNRVIFHGWVTADQANRHLRQSDVFVMPSLREVGGIVLLEAMAVELPVITTDWGGPAIHVTSETGIKIPPTTREGFVQAFAEAMLRLARDPALRKQMGQAGRQRVQANLYDWAQKTDRLIEIYKKTLGVTPSV